jgi:regulator of RNase E activity RraA
LTGPDLGGVYGRLRELGTSTIGGSLDHLGINGLIVPPIRPVASDRSFAGPAFTVKCAVARLGAFQPSDFAIEMFVDKAGAGDVIVIDAGGAHVSTMGGVAATVAQARGIAGVLIDGGARDLDEIIHSGLNAFVRHPVPVSGKTRVKVLATQVPVMVGSVPVRSGDIVIGDSTGVVCFPADRLTDVLELAEKADKFDRKLMANVRNGMNLSDSRKAASRS